MGLRVGVIGGGQLARMMIVPAVELGLELQVFSESEGSSAALATSKVGDYTKLDELQSFAKGVDVITFDHEHVPLKLLEALEADGISVQPPSRALRYAQNKLEMRKALGELGLPMPAWAEIQSEAQLQEFIDAHEGVAIVKTPIGGYDGKGVAVVRQTSDVAEWLSNLDKFGGSLLAEEKVDFVSELAQLSARRPSGEMRTWPLVQTIQKDGVCSEVISPAPGASETVLREAAEIAMTVAKGIGVTGVLAVELFEARDGRILINELAMRPHNSGHFSIEGSVTSQFEQHLRAVLDLPLGSTAANAPVAVMVNLLGQDSQNDFVSHFESILVSHPNAKFHTYGKTARKGRKMGHITVLGQEVETALAEAESARAVCLRG